MHIMVQIRDDPHRQNNSDDDVDDDSQLLNWPSLQTSCLYSKLACTVYGLNVKKMHAQSNYYKYIHKFVAIYYFSSSFSFSL